MPQKTAAMTSGASASAGPEKTGQGGGGADAENAAADEIPSSSPVTSREDHERQEGEPVEETMPDDYKRGLPQPGGQQFSVEGESVSPESAAPHLPEEAAPPDEPQKRNIIDAWHGTLSKGVQSTATWLDSFFGNERYEIEENMTLVKLRYDAFREEDSRWDTNPEIDLRLVLPQMKKKTRLIISGSPSDDFENRLVQPGATGGTDQRHEERKVTTALQYFFQSTDRMNISMRVGAQLKQGSPVLFAGPRYRYFCPGCPGEAWDSRFTQELFWWTDKGWQARTRIDLERSLPHELFFRTSLSGEWTENIYGYFYNLSFVLSQPLTRLSALQYEWSNSFETRPVHELEAVVLAVRYRRSFLRDWLFFEVAPQTRFPRERDFDFTPGILFRLEAVFGRYQ